MKKMTKEELIEYFIEQLGDNEILGQVMTIEQIRQKLNHIIKDVTYNDEPGNFAGGWRIDENGTGTISFDTRKISLIEEKEIIVHELLHALSTTTVTLRELDDLRIVKEKCGINISTVYHYINDGEKHGHGKNTAINEGMTDFLAEKITGIVHNGYNEEKSIYKVLNLIIGQETLIKKAFQDGVRKEEEPLDIFEDELIAKYGEKLGTELNEEFKKVSTLSDQLLTLDRKDAIYGLNENGKAIQDKTRDEIGNTLGNMIERIIDNEQDFIKKFDILTEIKKTGYIISSDIIRRISKKIQNELINSKDINYTKKLEMIRILTRHFNKDSIEEILLNLPEAKQLTAEERLQNGMHLLNGKATSDYADILYRLYVESGKVNEERFSKKEIFYDVLTDGSMDRIEDIESIDTILNRTIYRRMGKLIIASDDENRDMNVSIFSQVFNENGQRLIFQSFLNTKWKRRNAI